jgi:hypothetical protein
MRTFENVLIRCSSLGSLFTEPKTKAEKEAGLLSKTTKSHLIQTYIKEYWGIDKVVHTKQMTKGKKVEEDAITLVSVKDGTFYAKNEEQRQNGYISGTPDIITPDYIVDTKSSWEAATFLPKLIEPLDSDYWAQLQGYMWLFNRERAKISYCLCTTPESLRNAEKYLLLRKMDVATEENPDFLEEWARLEKTMIFDHIPVEERVIDVWVDRDEEFIKQIPPKVEKAREFLAEFHQLHLNLKQCPAVG